MPGHLIRCECGQQLVVEPRQAGDLLVCGCGKSVPVPPLRQLRELPLADPGPVSAESGRAGAWGIRQSVTTLLALVTVTALVLAGYIYWTAPIEPEFLPDRWTQIVDGQIDALTPVDAWKMWNNVYRPMANVGFEAFVHPETAGIRSELLIRGWFQIVLLAVAAVCGVAAVIVARFGRSAARS